VRRTGIAVLLALVLQAPAYGAGIRLERVGRFDEPVYVTSPPGAPRTLAVVERRGRVRVVRRGRLLRRPLADLRRRVLVDDPRETVDQRGLFSLAFAPDYRRSGRFYVQYVSRRGRLRVDELGRGRRPRRVLDLGRAAEQHHGGQLQFGPDGLLYVSTGINDEAAVSQDPSRPGGKILRVDPRERRPRPEIYALGLRNPWRFSFDRRTGALLIGDVGEDAAEEVNMVAGGAPPGTNFGWPAYEGFTRRESESDVVPHTPPALSHRHADGWCAITGGYVVRDRSLRGLGGRYLYGDLCRGRLWSARLSRGRLGTPRRLDRRVPYLVSFGEDAAGRLYAVSFAGPVYRLLPRGR
jgi:Glucose / Sorbosone dehydrogenase